MPRVFALLPPELALTQRLGFPDPYAGAPAVVASCTGATAADASIQATAVSNRGVRTQPHLDPASIAQGCDRALCQPLTPLDLPETDSPPAPRLYRSCWLVRHQRRRRSRQWLSAHPPVEHCPLDLDDPTAAAEFSTHAFPLDSRILTHDTFDRACGGPHFAGFWTEQR